MSQSSATIENKSFFSSRESRLGFIYFLVMLYFHLGVLLVFYTGASTVAWIVFGLSYIVKAMGVTTGFHRYFAHRSFKTGRIMQFILALAGTSAVQGGVLWWSSHHRNHHSHSDEPEDLHSPKQYGAFHSHIGWMWSKDCFKPSRFKLLDFARYKEIKWLNKNYAFLIVLQGFFFFGLGELLASWQPGWETSGLQMLTFGFFMATVWTWHITFCVNSVCHLFGSKRYDSKDTSRNNWIIAILAFGEGWHNNHHTYGWSARNGFKWWEWDPTWYLLKTLEKLGLVWDLKVPTEKQLQARGIAEKVY